MLSGVAFFSYVMENTARLAEDYKTKIGTNFAKEEKVTYSWLVELQKFELDSKLPQSFELVIFNDGAYKIQMDKYKVLK